MEAAGWILIGNIFLFVGIGIYFHKKTNPDEVGSFLFAEGKVGTILLAPSLFNSWLWTTSVLGAAEASINYGLSGGISYAFGAGLAFGIFTYIIMRVTKDSRFHIFLIDFLVQRYTSRTKKWYYVLSIVICLYIVVEIAAGVGFVFQGLFGVSFKTIAFLTVMIGAIFVQKVGTRGVLISDFFHFFIIVGGLLVFSVVIMKTYDVSFLYERLMEVREGSHPVYHNPEVLALVSQGSVKYFITAVFVGVAQLILDPSYYLKAYVAKDYTTIRRSFLLGGVVLFIPTTLLCSVVFGQTFVALGYTVQKGVNASTVIAAQLVKNSFGLEVQVLLGVFIFSVAITTIISSLLGLMSLGALRIHGEMGTEPNQRKSIVFGRTFVICMGTIAALIVISLENISLLTIDIFCGILFSSVAGVVIYSMSRKGPSWVHLPAIAILFGAVMGFVIWALTDSNWFYGTLVSFFVPLILLLVVDLLTNLLKNRDGNDEKFNG